MELSDILEETKKLVDWHTLGIHLKLQKEELDDIERRFSSQGSKRCKTELFDLWKKRDPDASWERLAWALEKCGETVLAGEIRTRHSQKTNSSPAKKRHVIVEKREVKRFQELERAYASLMSKLQTALEKKVSLKKTETISSTPDG